MKKYLAVVLTLTMMLTAPPVARSQTPQPEQSTRNEKVQDWQGMYGVMPGTKLLVELKSGRKGEGKVVSLARNELSLIADRHIYTFEQSGIQRIYGFKGRSRSRTARIGMGIGIVLGTFISVRRSIENERKGAPVSPNNDGTPSFAGFVIGALAGAGVGSLFGGKRKKELLYEAK